MSLIPYNDDWIVHPFDSAPRTHFNLPQLAHPTIQNNRYIVNLDVRHFDPSEISVRVEDNSVKVSGKREKKSADGTHYEYHHYEQHFTVPDNVNVQELKTQLDKKGILRIEAPVKLKDEARYIPVDFAKYI